MEEQLHRASNARLYQDPNQAVMQLHSRYTDLDCLADGHASLVTDCLSGDKNSILLMKKGLCGMYNLSKFVHLLHISLTVPVALSKMEELLMEMKTDVVRLPGELAKMPSVSLQLKMDEISTISKLAKAIAPPPVSQSVITRAPPTPAGKVTMDISQSKTYKAAVKEQVIEKKTQQHMIAPVVQKKKQQQVTTATNYQVAYTAGIPVGSASHPHVQVPPRPGLAVKTAEGNLVVYSVSSSGNSTQTVSIMQAGSVARGVATATTSSGGQQPAYTIGVPAYLDGSSLYQTVQLVSASSATSEAATSDQQVVYWPTPVVGASQGTSQGAAGATPVAGTTQLTMIQHGQVLQPVQFGVEHRSTDGSNDGGTGNKGLASCSVITID